ncbi:MAG TPA: hypothetical protein GYA10_03015 [Alphaproteobacteria bacterium]|nr:hypothetical protein [Alphaproteobacteria bacterium]
MNERDPADMAAPVGLAEKVRFLSSPAAHGGAAAIEAIETHWSWLFLTPEAVFKLKKPLARPSVDLRTLAARERNCRDELMLNRRLTTGIYRRLVPLTRDASGALQLGGEGEVVEWLIEMARLPAEHMLDRRLREGTVSSDDVTRIATRLAEFYAGQPPSSADGGLYIAHLRHEARVNRAILTQETLGLGGPRTLALLDAVEARLEQAVPAIEERIAAGRILEGHGDLRPEHVCLSEPLQIYDCLEFDRAMRIIDPFDEVNYLGLECEFIGAGWVRTQLLAVLDDLLGGRPRPALMVAYSAFRAVLRARFCLAHLLDDEPPGDAARWPREARAYLAMAEEELRRL